MCSGDPARWRARFPKHPGALLRLRAPFHESGAAIPLHSRVEIADAKGQGLRPPRPRHPLNRNTSKANTAWPGHTAGGPRALQHGGWPSY